LAHHIQQEQLRGVYAAATLAFQAAAAAPEDEGVDSAARAAVSRGETAHSFGMAAAQEVRRQAGRDTAGAEAVAATIELTAEPRLDEVAAGGAVDAADRAAGLDAGEAVPGQTKFTPTGGESADQAERDALAEPWSAATVAAMASNLAPVYLHQIWENVWTKKTNCGSISWRPKTCCTDGCSKNHRASIVPVKFERARADQTQIPRIAFPAGQISRLWPLHFFAAIGQLQQLKQLNSMRRGRLASHLLIKI